MGCNGRIHAIRNVCYLARDSSHKYTQQGLKLPQLNWDSSCPPSSATTGKRPSQRQASSAEHKMRIMCLWPPGPGPEAMTAPPSLSLAGPCPGLGTAFISSRCGPTWPWSGSPWATDIRRIECSVTADPATGRAAVTNGHQPVSLRHFPSPWPAQRIRKDSELVLPGWPANHCNILGHGAVKKKTLPNALLLFACGSNLSCFAVFCSCNSRC